MPQHNLSRFFKIATVFFLFALTATSQNNSIRFTRLSIQEGLSQSSVNVVSQDLQGFMWFGTQDGLNKYDGYTFTAFKHDPLDSNSLSENFVRSIFTDKSGKMWIGTDDGLNQFDPLTKRFLHFKNQPGNSNSLSDNSVWAIYEDKKGFLWVGTAEGGLNKFDFKNKDVNIERFKRDNLPGSISSNNISCIYEDSKGNLWIGTLTGGLNKYNYSSGTFQSYQHNNKISSSLSNDMVWSVSEDLQGNLWIGTNNGLNLFDPATETFTHFVHDPANPHSISNNIIKTIFQDRSGSLWIGTGGGGLNKFNVSENQFTHYNNLSFKPSSLSSNTVFSIYEDHQGTLWLGTDNGISKFDRFKQNFVHYEHIDNDENSLSSNIVWSIIQDDKKALWIGTDDGLNHIDRSSLTSKTYRKKTNNSKGTVNNNIYALLQDHANKIWIGTDDGLCYWNPSKKEILISTIHPNVKDKRIYVLFEDKENRLWVGTKEGLILIDEARKSTVLFQSLEEEQSSLPNNVIRSITQDHSGNIWIGTNGGGLAKVVFNNKNIEAPNAVSFKTYRNEKNNIKSINNNVILSMYPDHSGALWLGTYGGGLNKFNIESGTAKHYTEKNGLSNNVVYGIIGDKLGNLWMSTNKGIARFDIRSETFRNYYENDGLQSNEFNIGAYYSNAEGEIFFGGINGFNSFYPEKIKYNPIPPQVVITDFQVFYKSVQYKKAKKRSDASPEIVLNYRENLFSFEFSALHYSFPEKNVYAYKMEGFDADWNYVGSRRIAIYTKLDPGTYTFRVKAANSDGVWNEKGTSIVITIKPPFWMTWWFRIGAALLILGLSYMWYTSRISRIKKQKAILERQVKERTAKINYQKDEIEKQKALIESEKEKVEKLLLNILPEDTAEELKTKGKASARHYRLASIMFTDFKGFTRIAEKIRPKELVEELDRYFIAFDRIIEKYGIEKIKTIGDAYMCAGGLPIRNKSNPIDICLAGLEIQRYMSEVRLEKEKNGESFWELRIGIHTGELIAGVVGTKRFAYDIWGDSVNIASRMEASSQVGKVNISGTTYEMASEFFVCTYRGKIKAKNKGEIDMYFVERIRPELSADPEGTIPNEAFDRKMSHVLYSKILYKKAEQYIVKLLTEKLPPGLFYHGIHHTIDVCDAAEKIALAEGIEGEDIFLLKTAALFHDAGFTKEYVKNEPIGVEMSREILPQFGYSDEQIKIIEGIIYATQVPQNPQTHLEQIMCDADLDYLGRDDFHPIADTLMQELMAFGKIKSRKQWDTMQVSFLEKHHYFTKTSISLRNPVKLKHIEQVKQRLAEDNYPEDLS